MSGSRLMPGKISEQRLMAALRSLTGDIGVRLAGTRQDEAAADFIAEGFRRRGASVRVETFPVRVRDVRRQKLEVRIGRRWHRFPASLFSSTPGTDGRTMDAPLVFFEAPAECRRKSLSHLRGKAVVHLGCHIESREAYRRLMRARPAFLLFVDVRYPGAVPLADGMFPAYTRALGAAPTMNVAYMDAWRWKSEGATAARLAVDGGMRDGTSANVVAELPGSDPRAGLIFLGAHHDTQADSVGADDNANGVAGLLELVRVLAPLRRRRTIRLISFGAEEQLSLGSAAYVRRHRAEVRARGRLMFNLDGYGSWMGWTELVCNGPPRMVGAVTPFFERRGLYARVTRDLMPYADHFPFVAAGVPGILLWRRNCTAGRFFHHRPDDDITRVSPRLTAETLGAVAEFVARLANVPELPFGRAIPAAEARAVRAMWEDLFGGWTQA